MFEGHRHPGIGDTMVLACHVVLQGPANKGSCDFIDRSTSRKVIILASEMSRGTLVLDV